MTNDLKIIKKKYGEEMMHFCRDAFATLLEEPGVLSNLLLAYFESSKELFSDLQEENLENDFKSFIYRKLNKEEPLVINGNKTPQELLSSVGYDLYECKSEEDIQNFKKYYAPDEELCTFNGGRLNQCHVFFAVKKDVDSIKREDFPNPERQDLYGTSVISIQFDKNKAHTLSIKNRYNHTVANPDATFSNNLDNIVEGLTYSFAEYYGLKQKHVNKFEIPSYERDNNGKYYKYNYEIGGIYYCTNNCILVNHEVIKFPKERYILTDYFLIDRQEKTIKCYDERNIDSFPEFFRDNPINKIDLEIINDIKLVKIEIAKGIVTLELDKDNKIISLTNPYIEEIGDGFLDYNIYLSKLELPKVKKISDFFLEFNKHLKELNLPNVREIGDFFLEFNKHLKELNLPNVREIGEKFLEYNKVLKIINLPNVEIIGDNFLEINTSLQDINLPQVEIIGCRFLHNNKLLTEINLPNVLTINDGFLYNNETLTQIYLPKLEKVGSHFLFHNTLLNEINMPNIKEIGVYFLCYNKCLKKIYMPNVMKIGWVFLSYAENLEEVIINNEKAYQEFLKQHPEYQEKTLTRNLIKGKRG